MFGSKKGKACVISLSEFKREHMHDLTGHQTDERKLKHFWHQIGFDVFSPDNSDPTKLTAEVSCTLLDINIGIYYLHRQLIWGY